jgi:sigma-B regulation protein RsbU (phosphoserine phosphatase)
MKTLTPRVLHALLFLYIGIAAAYQIVATISRVAEYRKVESRVVVPFDIGYEKPVIASVTSEAQQAGISAGDTVRSINGTPYFGRALWQSTIWAAHPGGSVSVVVTKPGGQLSLAHVPLVGFPYGSPNNNSLRQVTVGRAAFVVFIQLVVPCSCLLLGCWVALARPRDPNAWFFLILLTYPSTYISGGTFEWLPSWLSLRLFWHLTIEIIVQPALLFLGLLFPERGRLDRRLPWLKWLIVAVLACGFAIELLLEYAAWYRLSLLPIAGVLAGIADPALRWTSVLCCALYGIALLDKLRTASTSDARRRLQVLLAGSIVGLGSLLIIWGLLPRLGIADPGEIQWLAYLSVVLMLFFPLSLAYVVIVQRAMDVRILLRMGTQYLLARTTLTILRIAGIVAVLWFIAIPLIEHHHSPVITILWTAVLLAFAVLYFKKKSPTDLVGQWVDRKFFREAYDAEVMLASLVNTARTISDPAALIKTVCHQVSDVLHVERIAVLLRRDGIFEPAYAIGDLSFATESLRALGNTNSSAPIFNSISDGHTPDPHTPELLLPLPGRAQLMGAMALSPKRSEAPYTPSDLRLLESIGVQTGMGLELCKSAASLAEAAIERANTTREMEIAREVQERLLPQKLPTIPGLSLAGAYRSVFGVGGDYYDVVQLRDGRLGLAMGDVSGKGISAALLMSSLRACLRTLMLNDSSDVTALMRNMNLLIYEASAVHRYATFFLGIYDPATSRLQYVNAGHNPPALIRPSPDGTCQHLRLETGGPVVGLLPDVLYKEDSLLLQPGDVLLTYTDGISEAMTDEEEEWGEQAMILAAQFAVNETAEDIVKAIFLAADAFTRKAPQHDDMTVLVMKLSSLP